MRVYKNYQIENEQILDFIKFYHELKEEKYTLLTRILDTHHNIDNLNVSFIVRDFEEGHDLANYCKDNLLTNNFLLDCFYQSLLSLSKLHQDNRVHGNIKPNNLILKSDGRVVIQDAGLGIENSSIISSPNLFYYKTDNTFVDIQILAQSFILCINGGNTDRYKELSLKKFVYIRHDLEEHLVEGFPQLLYRLVNAKKESISLNEIILVIKKIKSESTQESLEFKFSNQVENITQINREFDFKVPSDFDFDNPEVYTKQTFLEMTSLSINLSDKSSAVVVAMKGDEVERSSLTVDAKGNERTTATVVAKGNERTTATVVAKGNERSTATVVAKGNERTTETAVAKNKVEVSEEEGDDVEISSTLTDVIQDNFLYIAAHYLNCICPFSGC